MRSIKNPRLSKQTGLHPGRGCFLDLEIARRQPIGKDGRTRTKHLNEHRPVLCRRLLLSRTLHDDLHEADADV